MGHHLVRVLVLLVMLALPAAAVAAPKESAKTPKAPLVPQGPEQATVKIVRIGHLSGGKAQIFGTVPVVGSVTPFAPGQKVDVTFYLNGHKLLRRTVKVSSGKGDAGLFRASIVVRKDGKYAAAAHLRATDSTRGDATVRKSWRVSFPALGQGDCGRVVKGFKQAMAAMGYVSGGGSCFNGRTGREVLAYRKVNGMSRNEHAGKGVVQRVFGGRGGYRVRHPKAGEHAEVPLDKQVLVLSKGERPFAIYPVSTGKPSTPTVTGEYSFYRREPGYNAEGMYYSFYWHNGYAVHGYAEVPNYAASHGCVRTFIADQPRIYEQLRYGEPIFVF
ncbi:MAG TPA: L,D-transpeptidase [Solirubrobacterales bacterium]|nr:L,D-transpeptidase [Solirubrobacterales bacterium]